MLLNYGAFSTELYRESAVRYGAGEYGLSLHMMVWFYGLYLRRAGDAADPRVHSLTARLDGLPPACMVVTECDPLYDDNVLMAQALRAAGVAVTDTLYPGTIHGFLEAVSVADVAGRAFDDSVRWLRALGNT
jgi:acetyl esterase